jgi:hypothetical protein
MNDPNQNAEFMDGVIYYGPMPEPGPAPIPQQYPQHAPQYQQQPAAPQHAELEPLPKGSFSSNRVPYTGRDTRLWATFKNKIRTHINNTLGTVRGRGIDGVRVIAGEFDELALDWFYANEHLFTCPADVFQLYEATYNIRSRQEYARTELNKMGYQGNLWKTCAEFSRWAMWLADEIDEGTMLQHFMRVLPESYRMQYINTRKDDQVTWQAAQALLMKWENDKIRLNNFPHSHQGNSSNRNNPSSDHSSNNQPRSNPPPPPPPSSSGPVPMDINAVTGRKVTNYVPGKDYWADKQCLACGKWGHGRTYKGCEKHPEYRAPRPGGYRSYAAAVSTADHHSPVAGPSTATAATTSTAAAATASTSAAATAAAATAASAADRMDRMDKNMQDMMAMMAAMMGNN